MAWDGWEWEFQVMAENLDFFCARVSYFSCCYDEVPQQRQFKGGLVYFGSQFESTVHRGGESGWQECVGLFLCSAIQMLISVPQI